MNTPLPPNLSLINADDPLSKETVIVTAQAVANETLLPRGQRPIVVTVGLVGQVPVMKTGTLGDLNDVVNLAFLALDAQQADKARQTPDPTAVEEADLTPPDEDDEFGDDESENGDLAQETTATPPAPTRPVAPSPRPTKPSAQLSLF